METTTGTGKSTTIQGIPTQNISTNVYVHNENKMTNDEALIQILSIVRKCWSDAVNVNIYVNSEGIEVNVSNKIITNETSMRKINGEWCKREGDRSV